MVLAHWAKMQDPESEDSPGKEVMPVNLYPDWHVSLKMPSQSVSILCMLASRSPALSCSRLRLDRARLGIYYSYIRLGLCFVINNLFLYNSVGKQAYSPPNDKRLPHRKRITDPTPTFGAFATLLTTGTQQFVRYWSTSRDGLLHLFLLIWQYILLYCT